MSDLDDLLQGLEPDSVSKSKSQTKAPAPPSQNGAKVNVETYLIHYGLQYRSKRESHKGRTIYPLEDCPVHTDPDGHHYECCITQEDGGKLGADCKHDDTKAWQDFKAAIGPILPEHWDGIKEGRKQKKKSKSVADELMALAKQNLILFKDDRGQPCVSIMTAQGRLNTSCSGLIAREFITDLYYQKTGKVVSEQTLRNVIKLLCAQARMYGDRHPLYNRVAWKNDELWVDLANSRGECVRVRENCVTIETDVPILFHRYDHQLPMESPKPKGDIKKILDFIPIKDASHQLLLLVYLVFCFIPDRPHPVLIFHGSQGSGKSTAMRFLRQVIDPSVHELLAVSKNEEELIQQFSHNWFTPLDNVSSMPRWLSDCISRACTGTAHSKRRKFHDDEDFTYRFMRCIALNGINLMAQHPDLIDRSFMVELERIPSGDRLTIADLNAAFEDALPEIRGGIFDTLSKALNIHSQKVFPNISRMADFDEMGCAIAEALGHDHTEFLAAWDEVLNQYSNVVIDSDPVGLAVLELMAKEEHWTGTATELYGILGKIAERELHISLRSNLWPGGAHILVQRLNQLKPSLFEKGIYYDKGKTSGNRFIVLEKKI